MTEHRGRNDASARAWALAASTDDATCQWREASTVAGDPVDYSSGQRSPPREIYGMNHFDRHGKCTGIDVNWHVAVPAGYYSVTVDFAADSSGEERREAGQESYGGWDNCAYDHVGESAAGYLSVEGTIACYHRPGCIYSDTVLVTDDGHRSLTEFPKDR